MTLNRSMQVEQWRAHQCVIALVCIHTNALAAPIAIVFSSFSQQLSIAGGRDAMAHFNKTNILFFYFLKTFAAAFLTSSSASEPEDQDGAAFGCEVRWLCH
jgi:hypothetical protein